MATPSGAEFAGGVELKKTLVTGAAADTNIAIAGIRRRDMLLSVIEHPASAALVDRTATTSITSDGNIQCTASTAGNQLVVWWWKRKA